MIVYNVEQGTPEWLELRRGVATASAFDRIITAAKGDFSKQAEDYALDLIDQTYRLGPPAELPTTATVAMQNGTKTEPEARDWYQFQQNAPVVQVGFITTDCGWFGCSPDGLVGDDGGLELKCPMGKTHLKYLKNGVLPNEYKAQVHGCMAVTGRQWWDFVSYVPAVRAYPSLAFMVRVERSDYTERLLEALREFADLRQELLRQFELPPLSTTNTEPVSEDELPAALAI